MGGDQADDALGLSGANPGNCTTFSSSSTTGASCSCVPGSGASQANRGSSPAGRWSFSFLRRGAISRVRTGLSSGVLAGATRSNQAFSSRASVVRVRPDQSSPRAGGASAKRPSLRGGAARHLPMKLRSA
jgi:hypothetical protein